MIFELDLRRLVVSEGKEGRRKSKNTFIVARVVHEPSEIAMGQV